MSRKHSQKTDRTYDILLLERESEEIDPFIESFKTTDATEEVHVVTDGDEVLDFIHRCGTYTQVPRPDLIILDLHVHGADGEKILTELNDQSELRLTPVLIFTSSDEAEDIARSYELNANAYLQKPSSAAEFTTLAQAIEDFWLEQHIFRRSRLNTPVAAPGVQRSDHPGTSGICSNRGGRTVPANVRDPAVVKT